MNINKTTPEQTIETARELLVTVPWDETQRETAQKVFIALKDIRADLQLIEQMKQRLFSSSAE